MTRLLSPQNNLQPSKQANQRTDRPATGHQAGNVLRDRYEGGGDVKNPPNAYVIVTKTRLGWRIMPGWWGYVEMDDWVPFRFTRHQANNKARKMLAKYTEAEPESFLVRL